MALTANTSMTPTYRLSHHSNNLETFKCNGVGDITYDYQVPQKRTKLPDFSVHYNALHEVQIEVP